MKALMVYDSFFGNTEKIACAIGDAIGDALVAQADVRTLRVGDVKPGHLMGLSLLVVGSPTRSFSASPATKAWLKALAPNSLRGVKVAAFDTRADMNDVDSRALTAFVKLFGYAAEPIANSLTKRGGTLVVPPEGFFIKDKEGPLKDGEIERATAWGRQIAAKV
jgi:flavodoxin I